MSGLPPKYASNAGDDDDTVGLLASGDQQTLVTYPPTAAVSSSGPSGTGNRSVIYRLRTMWPLSDTIPHQQSVSVLGRSREVGRVVRHADESARHNPILMITNVIPVPIPRACRKPSDLSFKLSLT